jgi:hypothetical protein
MTAASSIFVFNKNQENQVNDKLTLCVCDNIKCVIGSQNGSSVAYLYFTNAIGDKIDIPSGFDVYEYDKENFGRKVALRKLPNTQMFALCCTDDYDMVYMNQLIHKIETQRSWKITHNITNFGL